MPHRTIEEIKKDWDTIADPSVTSPQFISLQTELLMYISLQLDELIKLSQSVYWTNDLMKEVESEGDIRPSTT